MKFKKGMKVTLKKKDRKSWMLGFMGEYDTIMEVYSIEDDRWVNAISNITGMITSFYPHQLEVHINKVLIGGKLL